MIRRKARARSGITLTEILISILILGVGVISLATLFPIGLIRLRNAQRLTRGGFLVESAQADLGTRNLLSHVSFLGNPTISQCYNTASGPYNPWIQDTPSYGADWGGSPSGVNRPVGPGLPVAYDPLWRTVCTWTGGRGLYLPPLTAAALNPPEARFGQGVGFAGATSSGFVRDDPNPLGGPATASAHGLQRLTNLGPAFSAAVLQTFVSPEDLVLQDPKGVYQDPNAAAAGVQLQSPSPVVPDLSNGSPDNDWRYSWFFTGQQSDASNGTVFDGEIVICENRPFGIDAMTSPLPGGGTVEQVTGETVVEAAWGWSAYGSGTGYGPTSAKRTVLLRWPTTMPDPDVRVGGWIADITYERNSAVIASGRFASVYPAQRCYWYQVAKKSEPTPSPVFSTDAKQAYRQMTVWTTTPLRAATPLNFSGAATEPFHVEAALIMPSVVNVYPRTVYTR